MCAQTTSKERPRAVSTPDKPPYQTPVVLPLGGISRGYGQTCVNGDKASQNCNPGSAATGTQCHNGNNATGSACRSGSGAVNGTCNSGSTAGSTCGTGTSAGLS